MLRVFFLLGFLLLITRSSSGGTSFDSSAVSAAPEQSKEKLISATHVIEQVADELRAVRLGNVSVSQTVDSNSLALLILLDQSKLAHEKLRGAMTLKDQAADELHEIKLGKLSDSPKSGSNSSSLERLSMAQEKLLSTTRLKDRAAEELRAIKLSINELETNSRVKIARTRKIDVVALVWVYGGTPADIRDAFRANIKSVQQEKLPCNITQLFYVGRESGNFTEEGLLHHDIIQDIFEENHHTRKMINMIKYASASLHFDYLLKIDTDVAVNWPSLCMALAGRNESENVYAGRSNFVLYGQQEFYPPARCINFEHDSIGKCWVYMSGGLYGLSYPLVRQLDSVFQRAALDNDGFDKVGFEDLQLGKAIKRYVNKNPSIHVDVVNWENGVHFCHHKPMPLEYINGSVSLHEYANMCLKR